MESGPSSTWETLLSGTNRPSPVLASTVSHFLRTFYFASTVLEPGNHFRSIHSCSQELDSADLMMYATLDLGSPVC